MSKISSSILLKKNFFPALFSLVACAGSTSPGIYFQLPAYLHTGSELMRFGCGCLLHKRSDCAANSNIQSFFLTWDFCICLLYTGCNSLPVYYDLYWLLMIPKPGWNKKYEKRAYQPHCIWHRLYPSGICAVKKYIIKYIGESPVFLSFWKNACRYFKIIHPAGVIIAFDQIIKILGWINVSHNLF